MNGRNDRRRCPASTGLAQERDLEFAAAEAMYEAAKLCERAAAVLYGHASSWRPRLFDMAAEMRTWADRYSADETSNRGQSETS